MVRRWYVLGWFGRLLGEKCDEVLLLYNVVVLCGCVEYWYCEGLVLDIIDGCFDMIVVIFVFVMLWMEVELVGGEFVVWLVECFVDDMDG